MKSAAKTRTVAPALLVLTLAGWSAGQAIGDPSDSATSGEISAATSSHCDEFSAVDDTPSERHARARHARVHRLSPDTKLAADRSGCTRVGKASFYAKMFAGRKMADGTPMRPTGDNAASLTLPLGTTAKVTNLETGKTAVVTIRDRGPYVDGRIVDLSPATARQIGLDKRTGVTRVQVAPIAVPMPDGEIKLGDGALEASNRFADSGEWNERTEASSQTP